MPSELFKTCIADSKAIKQAALANARASLLEAFNSKVSSVLSDKLKEEIMDEDDTDETLNAGPEQGSKIGTGDNKKPIHAKVTPNANKNDGQETEKWNETVTPEKSHEVKKGHEEASEKENGDESEITDQELDEIMAELQGDMEKNNGEGAEAPVAPEVPTADGGDETTPAPAAVKPIKQCPVAASQGDEGEQDETNIDISTEPEQPAEAPHDEEISLQEFMDALDESTEDEDGATKEETEEEKEKAAAKKDVEKSSSLDEIKNLKKENAEMREAIKTMQSNLQESNLLNAKVLYTNKLFQAAGLNDKQKMKIIEAFDLTKSIREVKLTYAVMKESFNLSGNVIRNKNISGKQSIAEAFSSRVIGSTKPNNSVITENTTIVKPDVNDMASRFQMLAGIKKKK